MVDIVQEIKLRTDLVELISAYVPLRKSGRTYKGLCPFHAEKTPSFVVDPERGLFRCYGCGVGGDVFAFVQKREGLSFPEAGEWLARRLGLEWPRRGESAESRSRRERLYDVNALAERFFVRCLEETPAARAYLERRGLAPETIRAFRLGYAPPGYTALRDWLQRQRGSLEDALAADLLLEGERGLRDRFVHRIVFPILDVEGRTIAFGGRALQADAVPKYLNSRETPIFQKGKTLYGLHRARRAIPEAGFAVAVEGYMDLIALHQAGIEQAVATLGTALTETHVQILSRYSRQLVMCYDGDSAGMRAAERSSAMFEAAECQVRVAELPEGEDPDTFVRRHGADAFRALLNRARPLLDVQIDRLRAGYNLSDETARLEFVREAARLIARSTSPIVRQEYGARLMALLERLAAEWYPGDPQRALQACVALRHEVEQRLRTDRTGARGARGSAAPAAPRAALHAREKAERYVLRAALTEARWAERLGARGITAEYVATPELRPLATGLLAGPEPPAARAEAIRRDPALAELLSALLLEPDPLSDEGFEECLAWLERARQETRLRELRRALEEQPPPADDPRWEELRALQAALGGRCRRED